MKKGELIPCPHCGHTETDVVRQMDDRFSRECLYCGATGPSEKTIEDAEAGWNRRATPKEVRELVEAVKHPAIYSPECGCEVCGVIHKALAAVEGVYETR